MKKTTRCSQNFFRWHHQHLQLKKRDFLIYWKCERSEEYQRRAYLTTKLSFPLTSISFSNKGQAMLLCLSFPLGAHCTEKKGVEKSGGSVAWFRIRGGIGRRKISCKKLCPSPCEKMGGEARNKPFCWKPPSAKLHDASSVQQVRK